MDAHDHLNPVLNPWTESARAVPSAENASARTAPAVPGSRAENEMTPSCVLTWMPAVRGSSSALVTSPSGSGTVALGTSALTVNIVPSGTITPVFIRIGVLVNETRVLGSDEVPWAAAVVVKANYPAGIGGASVYRPSFVIDVVTDFVAGSNWPPT